MRRLPANGVLLAAAVWVLAGCTVTGARSPAILDAAALAALESWELRGRVALSQGGSGAQARVRWRQEGALARLELSGPWGVGAEQVRIEGEEVTLFSEGGWVSMCAPEMRIDELAMLCEGAPLKSLNYWLRGLPDPDSPFAEQRPGSGAFREFHQDGWRIEVSALARSGELTVPRRIHVSGPDATLKMAITNWEITPAR